MPKVDLIRLQPAFISPFNHVKPVPYHELYVFSSINRPTDVVFIDYLDIAILEAKSIASSFCGPS